MEGKPATQNEQFIYIYIHEYVCVDVCIKYYFNYLDRFSSNPHVLNFMKILQLGAQLLLVGGPTERHYKANSYFSQCYETI